MACLLGRWESAIRLLIIPSVRSDPCIMRSVRITNYVVLKPLLKNSSSHNGRRWSTKQNSSQKTSIRESKYYLFDFSILGFIGAAEPGSGLHILLKSDMWKLIITIIFPCHWLLCGLCVVTVNQWNDIVQGCDYYNILISTLSSLSAIASHQFPLGKSWRRRT